MPLTKVKGSIWDSSDNVGVVSVTDHGALLDGSTETAAFQAAIDATPVEGGLIFVPDGTTPVLGTLALGTKVIGWLDLGDILPSTIEGQVLTSGNFSTSIVSGESSKDGIIQHRLVNESLEVPVGEIDRIYHVEITVPTDAGISTQREAIAYSFLMETDHHEPNGGDIRGIKGIVRGNGGQANLRAIHAIVQGYNGHTGDITGVLSDVFHSDKTSGVNDPTGKSACFIGQIGPGMTEIFTCRSDLRAGGVPERPNYAFRVQEGANAVRPEIACYQGHGGGNGDLLRMLVSDTDTTELGTINNKGITQWPGYYSGSESVLDDDVTATIIPNNATGFIEVWTEGASTPWGKVFFRATGTAVTSIAYGGTDLEVTTGALVGTTGTDTKLTVSADNAGNLYIENRTGVTRQISWMINSR